MKKVFVAFALILMVATTLTSCAGSRKGWGCPTNNPRYFRA